MKELEEELLGEVGIDSARLTVGDPCYVGNEEHQKWCVTVQSGYGDGIYPVYGFKNAEGRVVGLYVDMDPYGISEKDDTPDAK